MQSSYRRHSYQIVVSGKDGQIIYENKTQKVLTINYQLFMTVCIFAETLYTQCLFCVGFKKV